MANKKYETIVYIGRFSPMHNAHVRTIQRALSMADEVIVIVGSANQPRTIKNPWTAGERSNMIWSEFEKETADNRLFVTSVEDNLYNDQLWAIGVQNAVDRHATYKASGKKIGIIGHKKDESSFYLNMFPQWELIEQELIEPLNATAIRDLYFREDANMGFIRGVVPDGVYKYLQRFATTPDYKQLIRESVFIQNYKKQFSMLPYPPTFVTTDAVVIQSGNVLMVTRKAEPGKGLLALPGGFLNAASDSSLENAMLRELREETKIKVPEPVLRGSIKATRIFDAIGRSTRGRTITHAFKIVLPDGELPKVRGSDDAASATWIELRKVRREKCYEDHYDIIQWAIGA